MTQEDKKEFAAELTANLCNNILPYWLDKMVDPKGGFYGRRDGYDNLHADESRGTILNARILWTLAAGARATGNDEYAEAATRQVDYVLKNFIDTEFGGCYWSINPDGTPADTKKQFYAIAFTIYGLSEYYRLRPEQRVLDAAVALFHSIEEHSRDRVRGGYFEATTRDWKPIADMRLSDKDVNSSKTMNTHLHILEAYTCLLRVWPTDECREATTSLLRLFNNKITDNNSHHLGLFFDDDFNRVDADISYGHDIEASWLMLESAEVIGDKELLNETLAVTEKIAHAALRGRCFDGSMIYERHASGRYDNEKHWWVQAENVIGQIYLAAFHGDDSQWECARQSWNYIKNNLVDPNGEWYWSRFPDGSINRRDDKAGFWKCPYHNSRMCIEVTTHLTK